MAEQTTEIDWETLVPEIFQMFVADEIGQYAIHVPWHDEDEIAATDGRLCIRGPWRAEYEGLPDDEEFTRPPYRKLAWGRDLYSEQPLPLVDLDGLDLGREEICKKCAGGGLVTCNFDHEHECPDCEGSGDEEFPLVIHWKGVVAAQARFVERLQREGARLYAQKVKSQTTAILALWGDFRALIMPIKLDQVKDGDNADLLEVEPV
jgi:hypothetical protein